MDDGETTNPVEGDVAPEAEVETETTETEPQLDDDGNPIEEEPDVEDEEEVDIDGHKVKLPKSKAEKLAAERLMQADYTRKTQELAEARKALDAERTSVQQASAEELQAHAALVSIQSQHQALNQEVIQKYGSWDAFFEADFVEAPKVADKIRRLESAYQQTQQYLGQKQQERTLQTQQESAKRMEQGAAEIAKAIPDWTPATAAKLVEAGQTHFGFSKEDLDGIDDPRVVIALSDAVKWREYQASQKKASSVQKQQEIVPAAKVGGAKGVPINKLDDRLSTEEWVRRRNAQDQKRA